MTRHGMCVQARHKPCTHCGARPEGPCTGTCRPGVHLCRVCLATQDGLITYRETAAEMHRLGVFAGWSLVPDEVSA